MTEDERRLSQYKKDLRATIYWRESEIRKSRYEIEKCKKKLEYAEKHGLPSLFFYTSKEYY